MTIPFYLGFYGWPVIIAATIFLNWYRITKRHVKPYYFSSNWSRAIFGLACLVMMVPGFDPLGNFHSWITALPGIVYISSSFYLFFDLGLNAARKKHWDYQGEDSGWLDSLNIAMYNVLKALSFVSLIWSVIVLFR